MVEMIDLYNDELVSGEFIRNTVSNCYTGLSDARRARRFEGIYGDELLASVLGHPEVD